MREIVNYNQDIDKNIMRWLSRKEKQYYYHTHKHAHKHTHKHVTHIIGQSLDPYYRISLITGLVSLSFYRLILGTHGRFHFLLSHYQVKLFDQTLH